MEFISAMQNTLNEDFNRSVTENGAVGYRTSGKNLLDLNFAVTSLRSATDDEIVERFKKAYFDDKLLALKWMFFARDVRGGLGERRLFRTAMNFVAEYDADIAEKLVPLIAEYGRYDDLLPLLDGNLRSCVLKYIENRLLEDVRKYNRGQTISLLAKWLPSVNASSSTTKRHAKLICKQLHMREGGYRKTLSELRRYLDVVERKMSAKQWGEIDYETVPSRANLVYNNAFLRNDEERRRAFLGALERGKAKINSSVLYPHDIAHKYVANAVARNYKLLQKDAALEAMWKGLPDTVHGNEKTIVVADGSGSMYTPVGNGNVRAIDVANALAIYFSERLSGQFKDKYITFSSHPQLVDFGRADSLCDKLNIAYSHNEYSNTDIEAVFDLILQTAVKNKMVQEDLPANILIISDMEFDNATYPTYGYSQTLFQSIKDRYVSAGYKMPRLVFWNVCSRTGTIPVRENDFGVALVSGFSVNVCKMVMSGKTDPYECLLETVNSERYLPVEAVFRGTEA